MCARKQRPAKRSRQASWWDSPWMSGLLQLALAVYLGLALTGPSRDWWPALQGAETGDLLAPGNPAGPVGALLSLALRVVFGAFWSWSVPILLAVTGVGLIGWRRGFNRPLLQRGLPLWLASTAWVAQPEVLFAPSAAAHWGGVCGVWLARGFHYLFGPGGARIFLTLFLLVVLIACLRPLLAPLWDRLPAVWKPAATVARAAVGLMTWLVGLPGALWRATGERGLGAWREWRADRRRVAAREAALAGAAGRTRRTRGDARIAASVSPDVSTGSVSGDPAVGQDLDGASASSAEGSEQLRGAAKEAPQAAAAENARVPGPSRQRAGGDFTLPGLELLHSPGTQLGAVTAAELDVAADLLEDTLRSFGVEGEVKDVRPGPVVTTFEYQPAAGIKVSQITQRANDLALAMRARGIRMEAPIPGKAAVGIEIPNAQAQIVRLKEVMSRAGRGSQRPLSIVLGKDVVGQPVVIDIASLPHLLVAGATGSGKSVCLNCIICNLLLRNEPSRVRLVLIDPKMLEMSVYNGLPHLLLPVVTDPREALRALKWMVAQMDARYRRLAKAGVRNIEAYNAKIAHGEVKDDTGETVTEPMPYYLTIVDELAELIVQLGQEFEVPITRLAGKARAVGIHLILATQRPSVDVITGVIKANIPCRIAFRVIQRNDSRTILDMNGAESLLGNGDMLYLQPGRALPVRVHGALIEIEECEAIVAHWHQYEDLTESISLEEGMGGSGVHTGDDDLFEDARRIVVIHQSGSTSLLQRRLRVGYTRAGRLIDMLEEAGVVGPFTGSKAREVLLKPDDLPELQSGEEGA